MVIIKPSEFKNKIISGLCFMCALNINKIQYGVVFKVCENISHKMHSEK